jgi:uncharacterized SAM-binding protein YcdF (DUF218 family)
MLRRALLAVSVLLLTHVAWLVGEGLSDHADPVDLVVVLGTTVNPDGTLSPRLEARLKPALEMYQDHEATCILVSGGTGDEGVNEAVAMHDWLVAQGVPDADIRVDPDGVNTWATAEHTRAIMEREHMVRAAVVTSYYHVPRAYRALRKAGIFVTAWRHAPLLWEPREAWSILREIAAMYAYKAEGRA